MHINFTLTMLPMNRRSVMVLSGIN